MASTTAFASVRFYYPPGDKRLSHWRVIRFDVASGKILEHWTDPLVDALPFSWDPIGKRIFYTSSRRGQSESVTESLDYPGAKPRFIACGDAYVNPSPDNEFFAVTTGSSELTIIRQRTGNVLFSTGSASGLEWIDNHRFLYTRTFDKGPDIGTKVVHYLFDLRTRQVKQHTSSLEQSEEPPFKIESEFLTDTVKNCIVYANGKRKPLVGDTEWTSRWTKNIIQGLRIGDQLADGRYEIHTYAHRACGQVVGKLDPKQAKIVYWFSSPGDYRIIPDTEWILGWPLQVFTNYGRIVVEERPLYRARTDQPDKWERIWPGAHHLGQVWFRRMGAYVGKGL
jgi:hypothetical protein